MSVTMDSVYTFFLLDNAVNVDRDTIQQKVREGFPTAQVYVDLFQVEKGMIEHWEEHYTKQLFGDYSAPPLPQNVTGVLVMVYSQIRYTSSRDLELFEKREYYWKNYQTYNCFRLKYELEQSLSSSLAQDPELSAQ